MYNFLKLTSAILLIFSCYAHSADKSPSGKLNDTLILETGDTATITKFINTENVKVGIQGASNNEITNNGNIQADGSGIVVDDNATIFNTGTISTRSNESSGVKIGGGTITNEGMITATDIETKGIFGTGGALTVNNTGTITAEEDGIYSKNSSITINNNIGGVISGQFYEASRGIYVEDASATTLSLIHI